MSPLSELYSKTILEHHKRPHNFGELKGADIEAKGFNRSCGDDLRIFVKLNGDVIVDVRFVGDGCAISLSSASMMTDRLVGKSIEQAKEFVKEFREMVTGQREFPDSEDFKELSTLKGVKRSSTRIKCATLAWDTLEEGITDFEVRKDGSPT